MDVALASLVNKPAVVFPSRVNFAIAEAADSWHGTQPQGFFFTGHEAAVVGASCTHASGGTATGPYATSPAPASCEQAHGKFSVPSNTDSLELEARCGSQLLPVKERWAKY